jgi:hypothetical protein
LKAKEEWNIQMEVAIMDFGRLAYIMVKADIR